MTNIKKAVSKIEKAKSASATPAKTKAVKIAVLLSAIKAPKNMAVPMPEESIKNIKTLVANCIMGTARKTAVSVSHA